MATRTGSKQGRPPAKPNLKASGKDLAKGEKQPTSILEIVPGKFNETDWWSLLESDDTEDFIAEILDGIWTDVSKQIQQIYVRKQLLPFTLMMTENALSNVIQWAFLERDEPKPVDGDFWSEDPEPIPSTMDNWGEGVVPACREERSSGLEEPTAPVTERPVTSPGRARSPVEPDMRRRPSTSSSVSDSMRTPRSKQRKVTTPDGGPVQTEQKERILDGGDSHHLATKDSSTGPSGHQLSFEQRPYNHDVLVIHTQPPKLEPFSDLFYPPRMRRSSSPHSTSPTTSKKRRPVVTRRAASQLGSDTLVSTTNITGTTSTKNLKKIESKLFDDQRIEEIISKAPVAAHSMLKSILSRPPGYRDLELDDYGNVVSIAKLDPDKLPPRSIRVKCDVVKPRKPAMDTRPPLNPPRQTKAERPPPNFAPVKLVFPEQSTDVGDLIQPVPGVLYEDAKLKKGDPRRYQSGMGKYMNFHDESRPLRPIARPGELALLRTANDLLRDSNNYNNDNDNEQEPRIRQFPGHPLIPPILSGSNTSSA